MLYNSPMARLESHNTGKRKLSVVGKKTYAVTLPISEVKRLGWKKGDNLIVRRMKDYILVQKEKQ